MIINLNEETFDEKTSEGITLVDFYADWCGPCKQMSPTLNEMAEQYGSQITIAKVNVDKNPTLSRRFGVRGIPMFVVLKDGQEVKRTTGRKSKQELVRLCEIKGV